MGFEPLTIQALIFFQALFSLLLKQCSLLRRSFSYSHISSIIEKDITNGKENNYVPKILMEAEGNYKKTFLD